MLLHAVLGGGLLLFLGGRIPVGLLLAAQPAALLLACAALVATDRRLRR